MKKILTVTLNPAVDHTVEVPDFTIDSVNRARSNRKDPGGKGINVATALAQGGFSVSVSGFLGKDNNSLFRDHFTKNGLIDRFIYVDGATREGIKIADPLDEVTTDINLPGFQIGEKDLDRFLKEFSSLVSQFDYLILSGSLPRGVRPSIYEELARIAGEAGCFIAIDTGGEPLRLAIDSGFVNLIKPNIDELAEIFSEIDLAEDRSEAVDNLAEKLLTKVDIIALSLGEQGSRLYSKGRRISATAPKIQVKSTVGAGDTFPAGFIAALAEGKEWGDTLKKAASWAASKLTMYGSGLSTEQKPESFLDRIEISS